MFDLTTYTTVFYIMLGVLGLVIGSFLNVVIHRLPIISERNWRRECSEYLGKEFSLEPKYFNLILPASHCPICSTKLSWGHNIPLISYVMLRGKCATCHSVIPFRYLMVELFTCVLTVLTGVQFGISWTLLFALLLVWFLMVITFIDLEHQILPDVLTLPLLWLGLLASCFGWFTDTSSAILGAMLGYLFFWIVGKVFQLITKREGIGQGDFKLLAAGGAWLGWQLLPFLVLTSSVLTLIVGSVFLLYKKKSRRTPIPFAPFIAIAILVGLIWGYDLTQTYLHVFGINNAMN